MAGTRLRGKREAARELGRSLEWTRGALDGMGRPYVCGGMAHLIDEETFAKLKALSESLPPPKTRRRKKVAA